MQLRNESLKKNHKKSNNNNRIAVFLSYRVELSKNYLIVVVILLVLFIIFAFLLLGYQVINKKQYWSWIKNVFLPGVFAGGWYNGRPENQTMYIGNKRSVLVGMARGRQLRVQPGEF